MRKVLLALIAVALIAAPAVASVQNVKVSGDIESTYVNRTDFNLGASTGLNDQSAFLMQTRLRVDADLTDKVMATIGLINERVWGDDSATDPEGTTYSSGTTEVDLNLAYVTMKEMLYSPLTVTLGRQEFAFGNSFVIDSAGPNNSVSTASGLYNVAEDLTKQTAQDAIRLTFDYDPLTIDLLYSAIDQGTITGTDVVDDNNLYGVNANYQFDDERNTVVEGYFWVEENKSALKNKIYMPGVRASMNVLDGWNLSAEAAMQFGDYESGSAQYDREAYALQILSNYMLPFEETKKYQPVLGLEYTMYSGDDAASGGEGDYRAWDPMYENQNGGKIQNALFNATNSHTIGAHLTVVPMQDVTAKAYYDYLWLDKEVSAIGLVQPAGTASPELSGEAEETNLGQEVGLVMTYDYTEDVQFGARAGWFFPDDRFDGEDEETASQLLLNAKVAF
ncbi:MAG: alginate export family protein [Candidatus Omnitrophota bacterium]